MKYVILLDEGNYVSEKIRLLRHITTLQIYKRIMHTYIHANYMSIMVRLSRTRGSIMIITSIYYETTRTSYVMLRVLTGHELVVKSDI